MRTEGQHQGEKGQREVGVGFAGRSEGRGGPPGERLVVKGDKKRGMSHRYSPPTERHGAVMGGVLRQSTLVVWYNTSETSISL